MPVGLVILCCGGQDFFGILLTGIRANGKVSIARQRRTITSERRLSKLKPKVPKGREKVVLLGLC